MIFSAVYYSLVEALTDQYWVRGNRDDRTPYLSVSHPFSFILQPLSIISSVLLSLSHPSFLYNPLLFQFLIKSPPLNSTLFLVTLHLHAAVTLASYRCSNWKAVTELDVWNEGLPERVCECACVFRLTDFDSKGKGLRISLFMLEDISFFENQNRVINSLNNTFCRFHSAHFWHVCSIYLICITILVNQVLKQQKNNAISRCDSLLVNLHHNIWAEYQ